MTEHEWLTSTDPQAMLHCIEVQSVRGHVDGLISRPSDRKLRLFACACCRVAHRKPTSDIDRWEESGDPYGMTDAQWAAAWAEPLSPTQTSARTEIPGHVRAALLRVIVGNPFRRYAWTDCHDCSPSGHELQFLDKRWLAWNGGTVKNMAQAIYEEQAFDRMPIMADALEDAGCEDEDVLRHLRGEERCYKCFGSKRVVDTKAAMDLFDKPNLSRDYTDTLLMGIQSGILANKMCDCRAGWTSLRGPHVRGCWVLDLLLGKK